MADNLTISTAGGNETVGADEISSVKYQRVKLIFGPDGTQTGEVALASTSAVQPLPVTVYPASDYVMVAGLGIAPKFAVINLNATGTLVAAVASKKIRVLALAMTIDLLTGDETYTFNSGAGGTAVTGAFGDSSGAGAVVPIVLPFNPLGWFETTSGVLLELAIAGTTPFADGCLVYMEV